MAFEEALAPLAEAYADQTERDCAELVAAHKSGRIQAVLASQGVDLDAPSQC
jgi:hypothetical protein